MCNNNLQNIAKKAGLAKDQEGIIQRYFREKEHWDAHLNKTREFIKTHIADKSGKAIVFGSGWLLDVPLDSLSKQFDKLYLADIRHPVQVQKKIQAFPHVELLSVDLTGGLFAYALANRKKTLCPEDYLAHYTQPTLPEGIDCFISCNILNQLDILLWDVARKTLTEEEFKPIRSFVQEAHLRLLPEGKSCCIADIEQSLLDLRNPSTIHRSSSLYTSLPKGDKQESWEWIFDTAGRYITGKEVRFQVQAISF